MQNVCCVLDQLREMTDSKDAFKEIVLKWMAENSSTIVVSNDCIEFDNYPELRKQLQEAVFKDVTMPKGMFLALSEKGLKKRAQSDSTSAFGVLDMSDDDKKKDTAKIVVREHYDCVSKAKFMALPKAQRSTKQKLGLLAGLACAFAKRKDMAPSWSRDVAAVLSNDPSFAGQHVVYDIRFAPGDEAKDATTLNLTTPDDRTVEIAVHGFGTGQSGRLPFKLLSTALYAWLESREWKF